MLDEAAAGAGVAAFCPKLNPPSGCAAGCVVEPKENVASAFGAGVGVAAEFWPNENIPGVGCASVFCPNEPKVEVAVGAKPELVVVGAKLEFVVVGAKLEFVLDVKLGVALVGKPVLAVVTAG